MTTETLITILVSLLIINFVIWLGFLIFIFIQTRKIFKAFNNILENTNRLSSSLVGTVFKFGTLALGLIKGFNTVKSITTLSDIFEEDVEEEGKHDKKRK